MFRVLFLLLIVISSIGFSDVAKATSFIVFDEVLKTDKDKLRKVTENFQKELDKDKKFQGYIINHGTIKETARREKIIRDSIAFRKFDASKITIVRGGKAGETRTVFYLVPVNAELPHLTKNEEIK